MESNFASRAGEKLQFALDQFQISVKDKICADLGSSTGGFVSCLLLNGAAKVYSVDTSYGELAWTLRNDERVVVMERTNALHVEVPEKVDFISIDVGWTPQALILPHALSLLKNESVIISLIKPHYEADKRLIRKGKLPDENIEAVLDELQKKLADLNIKFEKIVESPIVGKRGGNREFLGLIRN
jgi:23S rRNA (cytidine1920-2'-O)/16S rRNA (cytidine1409-2'-O)-methyltransferase